jgi:hypothetical protein
MAETGLCRLGAVRRGRQDPKRALADDYRGNGGGLTVA